jgi:acetyl-CoA carboxylase carboxyltransferase component
MAGPGFEPDATIALPTAKIAVMGAEAAINAVYANKIAALPDDEARAAFVAEKRAEYEEDIDIVRLGSELVVDTIVQPHELRSELIRRYAAARHKDRHFSRRRHGVTPV